MEALKWSLVGWFAHGWWKGRASRTPAATVTVSTAGAVAPAPAGEVPGDRDALPEAEA